MNHDDLYFGCWDRQPGHDLRLPDGTRNSRLPFGYPAKLEGVNLDTGFCPSKTDPNGAASLHHVGEWTVALVLGQFLRLSAWVAQHFSFARNTLV